MKYEIKEVKYPSMPNQFQQVLVRSKIILERENDDSNYFHFECVVCSSSKLRLLLSNKEITYVCSDCNTHLEFTKLLIKTIHIDVSTHLSLKHDSTQKISAVCDFIRDKDLEQKLISLKRLLN